jgi:hypothetical protein
LWMSPDYTLWCVLVDTRVWHWVKKLISTHASGQGGCPVVCILRGVDAAGSYPNSWLPHYLWY